MAEKLSREDAVALLSKLQEGLQQMAENNEPVKEALAVVALAGNSVGYKPAFRALIAGATAEEAIKWGKS